MKILKNLFVALVAVVSLTMISCQGDSKDAQDKARESLATTPAEGQPAAGQPGANPEDDQRTSASNTSCTVIYLP